MKHTAALLAALALLAWAPAQAQQADSLRLSVGQTLPSTQDKLVLTLTGFSQNCSPVFFDVRVEEQKIVIPGTHPQTLVPCPPSTWTHKFEVGPLPAGGYTVEVVVDEEILARQGLAVVEPTDTLELQNGAFTVTVDWKNSYDPAGSTGKGHAVKLTEESGSFWFFDSENTELTVKILDGREANGHWWVFLSSMTTVEFTVTITHCPTNPLSAVPCVIRTYHNPPFENRNFVDGTAF